MASSSPPGANRHPDAGWSSLVARRAHNPKVAGSNPAPATNVRLRCPQSLIGLGILVFGDHREGVAAAPDLEALPDARDAEHAVLQPAAEALAADLWIAREHRVEAVD